MAVDFKLSQPGEYYRRYLEQDVRPDGRELGESRPVTLNVGSIETADGSALVKLGHTTVLCGIKAELAVPEPENPKEGCLLPNVELPPLCSAMFRGSANPEQAQVANHFMEELIRSSQVVQVKDLCVVEGKYAWNLHCDLECLDFDGNLLDACTLALLAALTNAKLPKVNIHPESGEAELDPKQKSKLNINAQPVSSSFAIFDDKVIILDPCREEETLATGSITIVTKDDDNICMLHKPGGSRLSSSQLQDCIVRAQGRRQETLALVKDTVNTLEADR